MEEPNRRWDSVKLATTLITVVLLVFIGYAAVKYLLPILVPFLLAAAVAAMLNPLVNKLAGGTKMPRRPVAAVCLLLTVALLGGIVWWLLARLWAEAESLLTGLTSSEDPVIAIMDALDGVFVRIADVFPFKGGDAEQTASALREYALLLAEEAVSSLASALPAVLGGVIRFLPQIPVFLGVFILSALYLCMDGENICKTLLDLLPERAREYTEKAKAGAARTAAGYVRAYGLLFLLTFAMLLLGLMILGVRYALLIALLGAVVDFLPVLGVGTVLVPWSAFCFVGGDTRLCVGLLILCAVIAVVRQLAEPRLVGESLGVHPLLTLVALYGGFSLFGVFGMLLGPLIALLLSKGAELLKQKGNTPSG